MAKAKQLLEDLMSDSHEYFDHLVELLNKKEPSAGFFNLFPPGAIAVDFDQLTLSIGQDAGDWGWDLTRIGDGTFIAPKKLGLSVTSLPANASDEEVVAYVLDVYHSVLNAIRTKAIR